MIDPETTRLSRLLALLTLLQTKRMLTATELAQRFSVSTRTIYRDIRTLEAAGIPVRCSLPYLATWLLPFAGAITIIEPQELRQQLRELAQRAYDFFVWKYSYRSSALQTNTRLIYFMFYIKYIAF